MGPVSDSVLSLSSCLVSRVTLLLVAKTAAESHHSDYCVLIEQTNTRDIWEHAALCGGRYLGAVAIRKRSDCSLKSSALAINRQGLSVGTRAPSFSLVLLGTLSVCVKHPSMFHSPHRFPWICCSALKTSCKLQSAIKERPFVCWWFSFSFLFFSSLFLSEVMWVKWKENGCFTFCEERKKERKRRGGKEGERELEADSRSCLPCEWVL